MSLAEPSQSVGFIAALYVRVSTDAQTVENQISELREVAERRGWQVVEIYKDTGIVTIVPSMVRKSVIVGIARNTGTRAPGRVAHQCYPTLVD